MQFINGDLITDHKGCILRGRVSAVQICMEGGSTEQFLLIRILRESTLAERSFMALISTERILVGRTFDGRT